MNILVPFFLVLAQIVIDGGIGDSNPGARSPYPSHIGVPTQMQNPAYPLRIRILTSNVKHSCDGAIRMWGRADLFNPTEQGFDYEADCSERIMVTHGEERYSAKWKKQDRELEILVSKVGTGKNDKCTFKAELKPFIYEIQRGELIRKRLPTN